MSTTAADFAQPIYMDEPAGGAAAAGGGGQAAGGADLSNVPVLNLDDPNLLMAEVETNQDANPYAISPPLPDGRWLVKIKQRDVKDQQGQPARYKVDQTKDGRVYAFTALDATVIDQSGKWDGISLQDYFVSTLPNARKGNAIPLSWILGCLKVQLPAKINAKTLLDEFFKATAGEPMLEIDTVWEGGLSQDDQERFEQAGERQPRVLGQHRFPEIPRMTINPTTGISQPMMKKNPATGREEPVMDSLPDMDVDTKLGKVHLHARPRVNGYYPVGSAKAAGMELGPRGK